VDAVACLIRGTLDFKPAGLLVLALSQVLLFAVALAVKKRNPVGVWSENSPTIEKT
jgi:hypothetical protein